MLWFICLLLSAIDVYVAAEDQSSCYRLFNPPQTFSWILSFWVWNCRSFSSIAIFSSSWTLTYLLLTRFMAFSFFSICLSLSLMESSCCFWRINSERLDFCFRNFSLSFRSLSFYIRRSFWRLFISSLFCSACYIFHRFISFFSFSFAARAFLVTSAFLSWIYSLASSLSLLRS